MIIQPTQTELTELSINGVQSTDATGTKFHVKEFRVYEDICKSYLTGQLVIETMVNYYETFLFPTAEVILEFTSPRSDGVPTKIHRETFKIYSYDSKPLSGGSDARLEHTIQLIGEEFYKDRHNTVIKNVSNQTGMSAAKSIHNEYLSTGGNLNIAEDSTGFIGKDKYPYQVRNMKPIKAIHDILDRVIFSRWKSGAVVYFRDKRQERFSSYNAGPLQYYLEASPIMDNFIHKPSSGSNLIEVLGGYNIALSMRPVVPPGETSSSLGDVSGLIKKSFVHDTFSGKYTGTNPSQNAIKSIIGGLKIGNVSAAKIIGEANKYVKTSYGGRALFNSFNENHQSKSVDKYASGRNLTEEALITALTYTPKYRVTVPLQTGLNCTCGGRINLVFPINGDQTAKTMFVPRLIHEIRFTEGKDRTPVLVQGTTELYCVAWGD